MGKTGQRGTGEDEGQRIDTIADQRREAEEALKKQLSVYETQVKQMSDLYGDSAGKRPLDQRTRLLVALGMAVHGASESAIEWTVTRALNHGVTPEEITEVVNLALLNGGTFVVANARFALGAARHRRLNPRES